MNYGYNIFCPISSPQPNIVSEQKNHTLSMFLTHEAMAAGRLSARGCSGGAHAEQLAGQAPALGRVLEAPPLLCSLSRIALTIGTGLFPPHDRPGLHITAASRGGRKLDGSGLAV